MPIAKPGSAGRIIRFGIFEVDLAAGELRKSGARIRLQEQPFQVLAVLLERPGEVVTREDLRQRLWPADTFVDFDHSLNTAINKIRDALSDSAASPRFVETLAKRGYRFIAPVQREESGGPAIAAKQPATLGERPPGGQNSAGRDSVSDYAVNHSELELPLPHRGLTRGLFALIQVMYLIFYVVALFRLREVDRIADSFLPGWGAFAIVVTVLVTAGVGIPLRFYLLSAVAFDYSRLKEKFLKLFPIVLLLDELWAVAPFLLMENIGLGAAFAATAGLVYLPFSERTLLTMAYPGVPKPRLK
jgi:DNA-binding winged helix-turn-helix (wHTH) protein